MTTVTWVILVIAIAAIVIAGLMAWKVQRSRQIKSKFGPEYDHVVQERGSVSQAEKELEYRSTRVSKFQIHPLTAEESERFASRWRAAQERFVDDPRGAVADADKLLHEAMRARGYPVGDDFDQRAGDISVNYPLVVEHYRAAHAICVRDSRDPVSTEDLRSAMKHYRALFEDLLERRVSEFSEVKR